MMTTRTSSPRQPGRVTALAIAVALAAGGVACAQSTWNWVSTTTSSSQNWSTTSNWSPNTVPSQAGAVVNFTANLTAGQTVSLSSARTIGTLNLGLPGNANRYNFSNTANGLTFRANSGDTLGTATINIDNNSDVNDGHQVQGTVNLQIENLVINNNSVDGRLNFQRTFNDGDGDTGRSPTVTLNAVAGSNVLQFQIQSADTTSRNQWGKLVVNQNAIFRNSNPNAVGGTVDDRALGSALSSYLADALTLNGGTLQGSSATLVYNVSVNRGITLGPLGGTLQRAWTVDSVITGSGGLTQAFGGTTTLNGANTYVGGTTLAAGTVALGSTDAIGSSGTLTFSGGTLRFSAANTTDYSARFSTAASQAYKLDTNGQNVSLTSALTSLGGSLEKIGGGTLTLGGASTYTGQTLISGGTLALGSAGSIADSASIYLAAVATGLDVSATAAGGITIGSGKSLGGLGTITGNLTLGSGAGLALSAAALTAGQPLTVVGTVSLPNDFGISSLLGTDGLPFNFSTIADGTYTLITNSSDFSNISNFGVANAADIGGGRTAYFTNGSLSLQVVPEPATNLAMAAGLAAAVGWWRARRPRSA